MSWATRLSIPLLILACSASVRADLIITFSSANILPEEEGTVDVYVTGEGVAANDVYVQFDVTIGVKPFTDNQPNSLMKFPLSQSTAYMNESDYVFFGQSGIFPPAIAVSSFPLGSGLDNRAKVTDDTFVFPPPAPAVPIDGTKLLARLSLNHEVNAGVDPSLAWGNKFEIFVVAATFTRLGSSTETPTSDPGTITSVPEPTTFGLAAVGAAVLLGMGWRQRRRRRTSTTSTPADTAS